MNRLEKDVYSALRGKGGRTLTKDEIRAHVERARVGRYWGANPFFRLFMDLPAKPSDEEISDAVTKLQRKHRVRRRSAEEKSNIRYLSPRNSLPA